MGVGMVCRRRLLRSRPLCAVRIAPVTSLVLPVAKVVEIAGKVGHTLEACASGEIAQSQL